MCRRVAVTFLTLVVAAAPLGAQQTEADLQRRIDSLAPLVAQAEVAARQAQEAAQEAARLNAATQERLDTLHVADMTIIAPSSDAETARDLFAEVWAESYVDITSASLSTTTFTFQWATYDVEEILVEGDREQVVVPRWQPTSQARARVRDAIGRVITRDLTDTELASWLTNSPFTDRDPADIYRVLILAGAQVVRRCVDGDVGACESALGLQLGEDVLQVWYSPEERRDRVLEQIGYRPSRGGVVVPARATALYGAALTACVELSTSDACDAFMWSDSDAWTPLPIYVRGTLVSLALQRGGPGAWARLLEDPTMSAEEALPYAAGETLQELVAEWRGWVLGARPEVYAGLGGRTVLSLLWILLFAALATRSTRWRFA